LIVDVEGAAGRLAEGQVVAYPTETVYGLGVDAGSAAALARLFELKGREPGRALSVLVPDLETLTTLAPDLPEAARRLGQRFWPGPLTLVVPTSASELSLVSSAHGVGFRCSPHPTARALARASRRPVVSTSCNRSGEAPCHSEEEVRRVFGAELPVVAGEPAGGLPPSTVVAVDVDGRTELLREGALPYARVLEELAA
jgi:L-threonylcarbamoyladenylate synthase